MNVIISSNIHHYQKTLPPLLNSLSASGVPSGSVTCVIGHAPVSASLSVSSSFNVNLVGVPYEALEFTALVWQSQQKTVPDFVFNLNDTTTVSSSFWNTVKDTKELKSIVNHNSMEMGVYPTKLLSNNRQYLQTFTRSGIDIRRYSIMNRDLFFKTNHSYFGTTKIKHGIDDFYNNGQLRNIQIYPESGITKYHISYHDFMSQQL